MQQLIQGAQMLLYAENQIISKALSWGIRSFWAFSHELPLPFVGCHSTHKSLCQVQLQLSTYPKHTQLIYFRDTNWTYPLNNFAIFPTLQPSWGILTKELPILNLAIIGNWYFSQSSHSQQVSFPQPHNTRTICLSILNSRISARPQAGS
jgi:hypothetical protein